MEKILILCKIYTPVQTVKSIFAAFQDKLVSGSMKDKKISHGDKDLKSHTAIVEIIINNASKVKLLSYTLVYLDWICLGGLGQGDLFKVYDACIMYMAHFWCEHFQIGFLTDNLFERYTAATSSKNYSTSEDNLGKSLSLLFDTKQAF